MIWLTIEERWETNRVGGARMSEKDRKTKTTARVTLIKRGIATMNNIVAKNTEVTERRNAGRGYSSNK